MQFSEVVGQARLKSELVQIANGGRLPHALLFAGKEGVGSLPLAFAFAQYLFCTGEKTFDSCGVCPSCQKVARLEHADLHLTFPTVNPKSGNNISRHYVKEFREFVHEHPYGSTYDWLQSIDAENRQGNITAEECREIVEGLSLKSYEGGLKVQIIWRPEYLNKEGNILLKLIEEPPAGTVLIFVAENPAAILPTILSRTQLVRIPPIAAGDITAVLAVRGLADERKAVQIGQLANGSFTEALNLIEHVSNDILPLVRDWFNALFTNNGLGLVAFAEARSKDGREQQKQLLRYVLELIEAALRATFIPVANLSIPQEEAVFVGKLAARRIAPQALKKIADLVSETLYQIERNANPKVQLLALSIKMQHALRVQSATV